MKYEFHPEALFEFEAAADFYAECQEGLEIRFIDAVHTAIRHACDAPQRWRQFDGEIRRFLVHVTFQADPFLNYTGQAAGRAISIQ